MPPKFKIPELRSVVCPYLIVESVESEINFLKDVFDAEVIESVKQPDGFINHGEVRIGDSSVMMGKSNSRFPKTESMIYVYVGNADTAYKKALEAGAQSVMPPEDRFYGNREGGVKDQQGNIWWIAQFLRKVSREEIEKTMNVEKENIILERLKKQGLPGEIITKFE